MVEKIQNYESLVKLQENQAKTFRKRCLKHLRDFLTKLIGYNGYLIMKDSEGEECFRISWWDITSIKTNKISYFLDMSTQDLLVLIKILEECINDKA